MSSSAEKIIIYKNIPVDFEEEIIGQVPCLGTVDSEGNRFMIIPADSVEDLDYLENLKDYIV